MSYIVVEWKQVNEKAQSLSIVDGVYIVFYCLYFMKYFSTSKKKLSGAIICWSF